jgi:ankyrin repeat protein
LQAAGVPARRITFIFPQTQLIMAASVAASVAAVGGTIVRSVHQVGDGASSSGGDGGGGSQGSPPSFLPPVAAQLVGLLRHTDWPGTFAQPRTTLDGLLDIRAALAGVLEALDGELAHRFGDGDGPGTLPPAAQILCDSGDSRKSSFVPGDDTHKQLIQETARYVVRAAPYAHASKLVKTNVRRVLGLGQLFTTNLLWAGGAWGELQGGVRAHMRKIGAPLDDGVFRNLDLGRCLGGYDPHVDAGGAGNHGGGGEGGGGGGGDVGGGDGSAGAAAAAAAADAGVAAICGDRIEGSGIMGEGSGGIGGVGTGGGGGGADGVPPPVAGKLVQFIPLTCAPEHFFSGGDVVAQDDLECTYIHFLRLMALALDGAFQRHVTLAFKSAGVRLVGDAVSSVGIKSYERMRNKMMAPEDHGRLSRPRPAHNIDVVRCLATFHTVDDMLQGFDVVRCRVFSQGYAQFKNGMAWSHALAQSRFHLRVVLGTGSFVYAARRTMGELRADPSVRRLWSAYLVTQTVPGSVARGTWKRHVQAALQWLDDVPAHQEVSMLCEVQMLLREYNTARAAMHELYKIVRADTPQRLHADFEKYHVARATEAAHQRAGDTELKLACRDGAMAALKRSLAEQQHDDVSGGDSAAALQVACEYARPRCVEHLLLASAAAGATFSPEQLGSALRAAAKGTIARTSFALEEPRANVVRQLVQAKADVDCSRADDGGATPAVMAAEQGHVAALQALVHAKADVDKSDGDHGYTPAFRAAQGGHIDVLHVLVQAKADVDKASTTTGITPAFKAAQNGHAGALQVLAQAKADLHRPNGGGATPTYVAAQNGHAVALDVLVKAKADVDRAEPSSGVTPAVMAARNGHADALRVLVQAKADLDKADNKGATPAVLAACNGDTHALQLLAQAKANVDRAHSATGVTPVFAATLNGRAETLRALVQAKADVDKAIAFTGGATPVFLAAEKGHTDVLQVLVHAKANVDKAKPDAGTAPAIIAAQNGHTLALEVLVRARADVDKPDSTGATAAYMAAQNGHFDALRVLVEGKAALNLSICAVLAVLAVAASQPPLPPPLAQAATEALGRLGLAKCAPSAFASAATAAAAAAAAAAAPRHRAFPATDALLRVDSLGKPLLLFNGFSTVVLDTWRKHPRSCFFRVEVVAAGPCPQLGFATAASTLPFMPHGSGTGDDCTSIAVDGVRRRLWCGGVQRGYDHSWVNAAKTGASGAAGDGGSVVVVGGGGLVVGLAVDLEARLVQSYWDGDWHDVAVPSGFDFAAATVFPSFTAACAAFRVLDVGPWARRSVAVQFAGTQQQQRQQKKKPNQQPRRK